MLTLKEILDEGNLTVGKSVTFTYSRDKKTNSGSQYSGKKVILNPVVVETFVQNVVQNYPKKLEELIKLEIKLKPLVTSKNECTESITLTKAKKKSLGIARWDKVKEKDFSTYNLFTEATKKLEIIKSDIKELMSSNTDSNKEHELSSGVNKFLRYFKPQDELKEEIYEVNAVYLGKSLSMSKKLEDLFLVLETSIDDNSFNSETMDYV